MLLLVHHQQISFITNPLAEVNTKCFHLNLTQNLYSDYRIVHSLPDWGFDCHHVILCILGVFPLSWWALFAHLFRSCTFLPVYFDDS